MSNGFPGGDEVVIRLTVDTDRAKQDMASLGTKLKEAETQAQASISAKTAAFAGVVGGMAVAGAQKAYELTKHYLFSVGIAEEASRRAMVGTLSMIDKNGASFEQLNDLAGHYRTRIEAIAVATGTASTVVTHVFDELITTSGQSSDKVLALTKDIANIGNAAGGPERLVYGFRMLEFGMVGARNPLVRLIMSTGTLSGGLKSVSQQLQNMDAAKRFEVAEKAVRKMSDTLKNAPQTTAQLQTSVHEFMEQVAEDVGLPIARGVFQAVKPLFDQVVARGPWIKQQAGVIGSDIGAGITGIGAGYSKMGLFAKGLDDIVGTGGTLHTFTSQLRTVGEGLGWLAGAIQRAGQILVALQPGGWAMGLARANTGGDFTNPKRPEDIRGNPFASRTAVDRYFANQDRAYAGKSYAGATWENITNTDNAYGLSWWERNFELPGIQMVDPDQEQSYLNRKRTERTQEWTSQLPSASSAAGEVTLARNAANVGEYAPWQAAMDKAMADQNQAMIFALSGVLLSSDKMQKALVNGATGVDKANEGMIHLAAGTMAYLDALAALQNGRVAGDAAKLRNAVETGIKGIMNPTFTGNIYITQDFKDQDPDRVALVFQRDLTRAALAPRQAANTLPGGW